MDPRLVGAAHAACVVACTLLLLQVRPFGLDPAVVAQFDGHLDFTTGAFFGSFMAFAFVQLPGLAFGVSRGSRAGLTLLAAGVASFLAATDLEAVQVVAGGLVLAPGTGFRVMTVGVGLVGCAAFLGLSEWARRGAGVAGPLLLCATVLLARVPSELEIFGFLVKLGEISLFAVPVYLGLAGGPIVLAGGLLWWRGIGERRLDDAPLGVADAALLVVMLLGVSVRSLGQPPGPGVGVAAAWLLAPLLVAYVAGAGTLRR